MSELERILESHINNITKAQSSKMTDGEYGVIREKEIAQAIKEIRELVPKEKQTFFTVNSKKRGKKHQFIDIKAEGFNACIKAIMEKMG